MPRAMHEVEHDVIRAGRGLNSRGTRKNELVVEGDSYRKRQKPGRIWEEVTNEIEESG
jgi:hypothetical protein